MYKKIPTIVLAVLISSVLCLTGCSSEVDNEVVEEPKVQQEQIQQEEHEVDSSLYEQEQEMARLLLKDYYPSDLMYNVEITKGDQANVVIMEITFTRTEIDNSSNEDKKYLIEQLKIFREKMLDIYEMNDISTDLSIVVMSHDNYCYYILNNKCDLNIMFYEE